MTLTLHPRGGYRQALLGRPRPAERAGAEPEAAGPGGLQLAPSVDASPLPATALPAAARVTICVLDPGDRLTPLAAALPDTWQLAAAPAGPLADTLDRVAVAGYDALVLVDADAHSVRTVRARLPSTPVVALLSVHEPAASVVDVLQAGADACVRGTDPAAVLVAHLRACLRRRHSVHQ